MQVESKRQVALSVIVVLLFVVMPIAFWQKSWSRTDERLKCEWLNANGVKAVLVEYTFSAECVVPCDGGAK